MNTIVFAIISVAAMGFICAVLLSVVSKVMHVSVDPRIVELRECLPGANCGACGFSGCDGYAAALIKGEVAANLCTPGGAVVIEQINNILGLSGGSDFEKKTAVVHCMGDLKTQSAKMEYIGINTCLAAKQLFGGQGACTFGCIGFGDCSKVCPSDAICVEEGLAHVDPRACTGCGVCVKACPTGVISMRTEPLYAAVLCKNTEKGGKLKDKCSKGCIGCMKCVKACPVEAIAVNEFLADIDYAKCDGCNATESLENETKHKECVEACVKKCIV